MEGVPEPPGPMASHWVQMASPLAAPGVVAAGQAAVAAGSARLDDNGTGGRAEEDGIYARKKRKVTSGLEWRPVLGDGAAEGIGEANAVVIGQKRRRADVVDKEVPAVVKRHRRDGWDGKQENGGEEGSRGGRYRNGASTGSGRDEREGAPESSNDTTSSGQRQVLYDGGGGAVEAGSAALEAEAGPSSFPNKAVRVKQEWKGGLAGFLPAEQQQRTSAVMLADAAPPLCPAPPAVTTGARAATGAPAAAGGCGEGGSVAAGPHSQSSAPTMAAAPHSFNSGSSSRQMGQTNKLCSITPISNSVPRVPAQLLLQALNIAAGDGAQQQQQQQLPSRVHLVLVRDGIAVVDTSKHVVADVQPVKRSGGPGGQQCYRLCGPQVAAMCDEHRGWDVVGLEPWPAAHQQQQEQQQRWTLQLLLQSRQEPPSAAARAGVAAAHVCGPAGGGGGSAAVPAGSSGSVAPRAVAAAGGSGQPTAAVPIGPGAGTAPGAATGALPSGATTVADVGDGAAAAASAGGAVAGTASGASGGTGAGGGPSSAAVPVDFWEAVAHVMRLCDDLKVRILFALQSSAALHLCIRCSVRGS